MYTTFDKSNTYFLYDREKDTIKRIGDIDDLKFFIADIMREWYIVHSRMAEIYSYRDWIHYEDYKWNNHDIVVIFGRKLPIIFNLQNLTGNDHYNTSKTIVNSIINKMTGEIEKSYTYLYVRHLYPYTFYNGYGSVFDIREIIPEVKILLMNNIRKGSKRNYLSWNCRHTKSHSTHYHSRRSTGWKCKKDRKQWMHNVRNKKHFDQNVSYRLWYKDAYYDDRTIYDFEEDYNFIKERR